MPEPQLSDPQANAPDLHLQFAPAPDARTFISHQFSRYPFHICRAQYMDAKQPGLATVYLQSSAGGIFANDRLYSRLHVLPGAMAHVTSQASTVVHRMERGDARQSVEILAEGDAFLEYVPDPLILFPKARLRSCVSVSKDPSSTVILTDSFLAHDPAAGGEVFSQLYNEIHIKDLEQNTLCLDRNVFSGNTFTEGVTGVMGGNSVQGTLLVLNSSLDCELAGTTLRDSLKGYTGVYVGISSLPNHCGIWARVLSRDVVALRGSLNELWRSARKLLSGSYPNTRRK